MRKTAESIINDSVVRTPTGDVLGYALSNRTALNKILSLCGISEDRLNLLDKEDILFTRVESDPAWYRHQTGYCIAVDTENHFTALLPGGFGGYYFYDDQDKKHKANAKTTANFTKVYCLCRLLPKETLTILSLLEYLMSFMRKHVFRIYILLSIIAGILAGQVADLSFILERLVNSKSMWQMISFLFDGAAESEKKTKCSDFSPRLHVCDRIILLEKGHITQQGTYDELVAQEGLFRELVKCQGTLE